MATVDEAHLQALYRGDLDLVKNFLEVFPGLLNEVSSFPFATLPILDEKKSNPLEDSQEKWIRTHQRVVSFRELVADPLPLSEEKDSQKEKNLPKGSFRL